MLESRTLFNFKKYSLYILKTIKYLTIGISLTYFILVFTLIIVKNNSLVVFPSIYTPC